MRTYAPNPNFRLNAIVILRTEFDLAVTLYSDPLQNRKFHSVDDFVRAVVEGSVHERD